MLFDQLLKFKASFTDSIGWLKAKLIYLEHLYCTTPSKQECLLSCEHIITLKASRANEHLVFLKLGKGSSPLLMDKSDYQTKMKAILIDPSKFHPESKVSKPRDMDVIMRKKINSPVDINSESVKQQLKCSHHTALKHLNCRSSKIT